MKTIQTIRLTKTEGSADKEYRIHLHEVSTDQYMVAYQNGRRNGTLQGGNKTKEPVTLADAQMIYNKVLKEKTADGYIVDGATAPSEYVSTPKEKSATLVQLLKEIKNSVDLIAFINNDNFVLQEKKDGERRTVNKTKNAVAGGNKKGEPVDLPKCIVSALTNHKDIVLDAEIIGETLYVFDILRYDGKDLKKQPYSKRLELLESLEFGNSIKKVATAKTKKEKKSQFDKFKEENAEGVVLKDITGTYSVGRDASTAYKFKFYKTATVKVSGNTKGKRSIQMAVKVKNEFVDVGAVTIPPNKEIPEINSFIEVRYLYAYKGGSLFQPTFLFLRNDADDSDAVVEQLSYKQGQE
jgi:bifunctional non-homologous end joining protein LigD